MSELRKDPILGRWVIIAPDRAKRPSDFLKSSLPASPGGICPFCPGKEELTPPEILAVRRPGTSRDQPGWSVRVVPNKFPALRVEGELAREGEGMFDRMSGIGAHEVVIESSDHAKTLSDLAPAEVEEVLWTWGERIRDLSRDTRLRSVVLFKNHGEAAGATLEHAHSQLIALPVVPLLVAEEMKGAQAHHRTKERCIFCDVIRQERKDGVRLVLENEGCVVISPWAAASPFQLCLFPKNHLAHFEEEPRANIRWVAEALRTALRKLAVAFDRPAYNIILHSAPLRERGLTYYHWHLEIRPAVTRFAGFEWGSGFFINPVSPEDAAAFLRKTDDS